jgi:mRNA interferase MazF
MARGDVLLVELPDSTQREERGTRPAIAVQTENNRSPMLMIIPVTSSLGATRFPFTVQLEPSEMNGLTMPSIAMVFQLRAIDKRRIIRTIGTLAADDLAKIDAEIWKMLGTST